MNENNQIWKHSAISISRRAEASLKLRSSYYNRLTIERLATDDTVALFSLWLLELIITVGRIRTFLARSFVRSPRPKTKSCFEHQGKHKTHQLTRCQWEHKHMISKQKCTSDRRVLCKANPLALCAIRSLFVSANFLIQTHSHTPARLACVKQLLGERTKKMCSRSFLLSVFETRQPVDCGYRDESKHFYALSRLEVDFLSFVRRK